MSTNLIKSHVSTQNFVLCDWSISVKKSHILQSRCTNSTPCMTGNAQADGNAPVCDFCKYEKELNLPQLPEMTFPSNILRLTHSKGCGIEFSALDALGLVDSKNDLMKVAISEAWQDCRLENASIREVVKPFDWTYTTHYKGTLFGNLKVSPTAERINIEKLKVKEKINFYDDIILFEDELADNGVAQHSVKIRVMPDSFFVLMRFFLRVDNVMVRIIDTRVYYEMESDYILREFLLRESKIQDLEVPSELLKDPQALSDHLPVIKNEFEKIEFIV